MGTRATSLARRIERLGRVAKDLRDAFGLDRDAQPALAVDGDAVVLGRTDLACVFCGSTEHVMRFRGKGICVDCVTEVRNLVSAG